jgi:2,3-bisphosphoglycerate-dependent phosphoglycerate mutase
VTVSVVFETHATSEDNERGIATGWLPGRLSERGREFAARMGVRRRDDGLAAVFCSDLRRAVETVEIAFAGTDIPVLYDWRLRETDYGVRNGTPVAELKRDRMEYVDRPYGNGESRRQAIRRAAAVLDDLPSRWDGRRVMLVGHVATYQALEHVLNGHPVEDLVAAEMDWRETGWQYRLG